MKITSHSQLAALALLCIFTFFLSGVSSTYSYACTGRSECMSCGDGYCDVTGTENCQSCPFDCGLCQGCSNVTCGDGYCDALGGETGCNCPEDCECCIDGFCSASEQYTTCPQDCGAALRGIVVDEYDWSPLPGSNVVCGPYGAEQTFNQITDENARFVFDNIPPGLYKCSAEYGVSISSTYTFYVSPGSHLIANRTEVIPIALPTGILSGTTYFKPTGQVFPSARVVCVSGADRRETFSDMNGVYIFTGVHAGTYTCVGTYPGYTSDSGSVEVVRGSSASLDLFLDKIKGGIIGNVLDCTTGLPVESVVTCVTVSGTLTTNTTNGWYYFPNVGAGVAFCTAVPYDTGYCQNNNTGVVPTGLNLTLNILVTAIPSNLSGVVYDADTREVLPAADVVCTSASGVYATISITDGRWSYTNITAGNYSCHFSKTGYNSTTISGIELPSYSVKTAPDAYLARLRSCVRLTVFNPYTYVGDNATVRCFDVTGNQIVNQVTPPSGEVFLTGVIPGTLQCTVSVPGYADRTANIPVPPGDNLVRYDFQLLPDMGTFKSLMTDVAGTPIRGVDITCTSKLTGDTYSSTTDSSGTATWYDIPVGSYSCESSYRNYPSASFKFNLTSVVIPTITLVITTPPAGIAGRVVDSGYAAPLSGARVNCTHLESSSSQFHTTDQTGLFFFNNLDKFGPWRCQATLSGYKMTDSRGFIPVVTSGGSSSTIQIGLTALPGRLNVQVRSGAGAVLPEAKLYCGRQNEPKTLVELDSQASVSLERYAGLYSCTAVYDPLYLPVTSPFVQVNSGQASSLTITLNLVPVLNNE